MPAPKSGEKRISTVKRQAEALKLRSQGKGFQAIADELGYRGPSGAYQAVMAALDATLQEPADEARILEAERLDRLYEKTMERIDKDNLWAVDRALKIMERRAGLLGLDRAAARDLSREADAFLSGVQTVKGMQGQDLSEAPSE